MNPEEKKYVVHFAYKGKDEVKCTVCCETNAIVRHIREKDEAFGKYDNISNLIAICTRCIGTYWGSRAFRAELQKMHNCKLKLYHDGL